MTHKVFWTVGLSDGTTLHENKGDYLRDQEQTPWERLLYFLKAHSLRITSLGLYTEDGNRYRLPSRGRLKLEEFAAKVQEKGIELTSMRVFKGKELAVHYKYEKKEFPKVLATYPDLLTLLRDHATEGVTGMAFFERYIDEEGKPQGRPHYLPLHFKNPRVAAFSRAEQPSGYHFFRVRGEDGKVEGTTVTMKGSPDVYTVAEAQYPDGKRLQIWVSEKYPEISWSVVL